MNTTSFPDVVFFMRMDFQEPKFDKKWFEKYQPQLLNFVNSWLGRWFFALNAIEIPRVRIMSIQPNFISYDWKLIFDNEGNPRMQKTTCFMARNRFQKRLLYVYNHAKNIVGSAIAWKMLQPQGAFGFLPAIALTTTTFFPDPNVESTSVDGYAARQAVSESWGTIKAGAGNFSGDSDVSGPAFFASNAATSGKWYGLYRSIFLFDTSALGSTASISSAVMSLRGTTKFDQGGNAPSADVYTSTPASNTAVVNGDFTQLGTTSQTGAPVAYASLSTVAYTDFTFSATGISNVSLTGISKFGVREATYDVGSSTPSWTADSDEMSWTVIFADTALTTTDPKLVITYSVSLAVSVNDTATIAESLTISASLGGISVNDAITVSESITVNNTFLGNISVSDAITVTEALTYFEFPMMLSVNDSITVTESLTLSGTLGNISINDAITVSETVIAGPAPMGVSVNEAVTISESVTVTNTQLGPINVNDAITITESINEQDNLNDIEDMVETITISEAIFMAVFNGINVSDSITVTESVQMLIQLDTSVIDTVTVSENLGATGPVIHAPRTNLTHMRSTEQQYPLMMDENEVN